MNYYEKIVVYALSPGRIMRILLFLLWAIGNVPFILIQRYNQPPLCKLYFKLKVKEGHASPNVRYFYENFGSQL